jgi:hypothetical protein
VHVRDFFRLAPSQNDHHPAIRCAIGVGVPLLVLLAIGRADLSIFAVLGAFTGVYGRGLTHRPRFSQQWRAGALLLVTVIAGTIASRFALAPEMIVEFAAIVAALGSISTSLTRLKPAGSLFFVFAFSAIAFMPTPAPFWQAGATAAASVLLSLLVGVSGRLLPGHWTPWVPSPAAPLSAAERGDAYAESLLHFASVAIAGTIAVQVGFGHSYWAMIAATVPLVGASAAHRMGRGLQRMLGTAGGLVIAGILLSLPLLGWQIVLVVLVLQFFVELFVTRHYALAQLFVTPLALLMTEAAHPAAPWTLMRDRGVETVIGAVVGMILVVALHRIQVLRATGHPGNADSRGEYPI